MIRGLKEIEDRLGTIAVRAERPERIVVAVEQSFHPRQSYKLGKDVEQVIPVDEQGVLSVPEPLSFLCGLGAAVRTSEIDFAEKVIVFEKSDKDAGEEPRDCGLGDLGFAPDSRSEERRVGKECRFVTLLEWLGDGGFIEI